MRLTYSWALLLGFINVEGDLIIPSRYSDPLYSDDEWRLGKDFVANCGEETTAIVHRAFMGDTCSIYEMSNELGKGGMGSVVTGMVSIPPHMSATGHVVSETIAVKTMLVEPSRIHRERGAEHLLKEFKILLAMAQFGGVTRVYKYQSRPIVKKKKKDGSLQPFIEEKLLMERIFSDMGDYYIGSSTGRKDQNKREPVVISQYRLRKVMTEISRVLRLMSYLGLVHRDIKPRNLVIRRPSRMEAVEAAEQGISEVDLCAEDEYLLLDFGLTAPVTVRGYEILRVPLVYDKKQEGKGGAKKHVPGKGKGEISGKGEKDEEQVAEEIAKLANRIIVDAEAPFNPLEYAYDNSNGEGTSSSSSSSEGNNGRSHNGRSHSSGDSKVFSDADGSRFKGIAGTVYYMSMNQHLKGLPNALDDWYGLVFSMITLVDRTLPWITTETKKLKDLVERNKRVAELKREHMLKRESYKLVGFDWLFDLLVALVEMEKQNFPESYHGWADSVSEGISESHHLRQHMKEEHETVGGSGGAGVGLEANDQLGSGNKLGSGSRIDSGGKVGSRGSRKVDYRGLCQRVWSSWDGVGGDSSGQSPEERCSWASETDNVDAELANSSVRVHPFKDTSAKSNLDIDLSSMDDINWGDVLEPHGSGFGTPKDGQTNDDSNVISIKSRRSVLPLQEESFMRYGASKSPMPRKSIASTKGGSLKARDNMPDSSSDSSSIGLSFFKRKVKSGKYKGAADLKSRDGQSAISSTLAFGSRTPGDSTALLAASDRSLSSKSVLRPFTGSFAASFSSISVPPGDADDSIGDSGANSPKSAASTPKGNPNTPKGNSSGSGKWSVMNLIRSYGGDNASPVGRDSPTALGGLDGGKSQKTGGSKKSKWWGGKSSSALENGD